MENKEYLNEETYQKSNQKVKKIGNILIIVGLVLLIGGFILTILGFLGFGRQITNGMEMGQPGVNPNGVFSSFGGFAIGGFMMVPGLFITAVGFMVRFLIGNRREITAYTTQQVMPVAKEGIEKMAPTIGSAVGTIGKELAKGIKEGINEADNKISLSMKVLEPAEVEEEVPAAAEEAVETTETSEAVESTEEVAAE